MHLKQYQGFTLIEIVIVILILGIIIGMSSSLLSQGLASFSAGENIANASWQGQLAIERLSQDIRLIRSNTDVTTLGANNFAFTDVDGNTISYALSGTSLNLTQNGNAETLADGVQSLAFNYFDKNGAVTATTTLVRYIQITLNITKNNVNYSITTAIYPRNLS